MNPPNSSNRNVILLRVNWSYSENFGVRIPHVLTAKQRGIKPNQWVEFKLRRDPQTRQWVVTDLKRVQRETEEQRRMKQEVADLRKMVDEMKQSSTPKGPSGDDDAVRIEF